MIMYIYIYIYIYMCVCVCVCVFVFGMNFFFAQFAIIFKKKLDDQYRGLIIFTIKNGDNLCYLIVSDPFL